RRRRHLACRPRRLRMVRSPRRRAPARRLKVLSLDVEKQLGAFQLAAKFETEARVTVLFGPSGAGKTTIVNMVAGLIAPDRGRIMYRGKLLFDAAGELNVPPHRRRFGYVFQDGRLFPHLTVRGNLEYGRRMYRLKRDPGELDRVVAMLDIAHLSDRRP